MRAFLPLLPLAYAGGLIVALYSAFDAYIFFFYSRKCGLLFNGGRKNFLVNFYQSFLHFFTRATGTASICTQ